MYEQYIEKGLLSKDQCALALDMEKRLGIEFHKAVIRLGFLDENRVVKYCKSILND